ncbi:unnamed protein product [Prunus armeniaca]
MDFECVWRSFFITKLSEPHTKAPEHCSTRRKLSNETFGRKLAKIFENFEEKPVASGSIVQVHGAGQQLKPIVVAVKQLLEKVRRHRVNVDGNVCTVMVTTLVREEWQQKLDPSEQGAYIAESITAKNVKQAKSHFRMYEDATDHGGSNHSAKVEPANGCTGERETGKSAKKLDKGRTAKEEASKREKVREIQKNLPSML